jgi:hypothetical protein
MSLPAAEFFKYNVIDVIPGIVVDFSPPETPRNGTPNYKVEATIAVCGMVQTITGSMLVLWDPEVFENRKVEDFSKLLNEVVASKVIGYAELQGSVVFEKL